MRTRTQMAHSAYGSTAAAQLASWRGSRRFDAACLHHGIYVPQGISSAVTRQLGVRVSTWNPAFRNNCFIFSQDDTYQAPSQEHTPRDYG